MGKEIKTNLILLILFITTLTVICLYRSIMLFPTPASPEPCDNQAVVGDNHRLRSNANKHDQSSMKHVHMNEETVPGLINRFVDAIKIQTITSGMYEYDKDQLVKMHHFIQMSFPLIHSSPSITWELVANYSLLYTIKGSDESLQPYMLCSHLDVVPVEKDKWTVPAFDGIIKDGHIYGRGTLDVKDSLMGILESLEFLLKSGFSPRRSFYLAFGHDEEGSGYEGAAAMANVLRTRLPKVDEERRRKMADVSKRSDDRKGADTQPSGNAVATGSDDGQGSDSLLLYLLDEGSIILKGSSFPGVSSSVALVGVAEKGYLTLRLTAAGDAGHSSMVPPETTIVTLSKALTRFTSTVHPSRFGQGPEKGLFESLAPFARYPFKLIYSNLWLFNPILSVILSMNPMSNGLVRTTSAVTMIGGGVKENVIPSSASATINHRLHPVDSIDSVINYDRTLINNEDIMIEKLTAFEPHPTSPFDADSFGYNTIKKAISTVFNDTIVVPGIMVASTDTKWYLNLTKSIYRFTPAHLLASQANLFHGHDERISVTNYIQAINFYKHVIIESDHANFVPFDTNDKKDEL